MVLKSGKSVCRSGFLLCPILDLEIRDLSRNYFKMKMWTVRKLNAWRVEDFPFVCYDGGLDRCLVCNAECRGSNLLECSCCCEHRVSEEK